MNLHTIHIQLKKTDIFSWNFKKKHVYLSSHTTVYRILKGLMGRQPFVCKLYVSIGIVILSTPNSSVI